MKNKVQQAVTPSQPIKLSEDFEPCRKSGCMSLAKFGYQLCRPHIEDWRKSSDASQKVYDLRPVFESWLKK